MAPTPDFIRPDTLTEAGTTYACFTVAYPCSLSLARVTLLRLRIGKITGVHKVLSHDRNTRLTVVIDNADPLLPLLVRPALAELLKPAMPYSGTGSILRLSSPATHSHTLLATLLFDDTLAADDWTAIASRLEDTPDCYHTEMEAPGIVVYLRSDGEENSAEVLTDLAKVAGLHLRKATVEPNSIITPGAADAEFNQ